MKKNTFMIVDSQPLFYQALRDLLFLNFNPEHILYADNVADAYVQIKISEIDLLIIDVKLKDGSGLDLVTRIKTQGFNGKVLFVSSRSYDSYSSIAQSSGAQGYVTKNEEKEIILGAITNILKGYNVFKASKTTNLANVNLSQRELSVLNYLSEGYSNKQISNFLALSEKTVSTYKARILKKYNVSSLVHILNTVNVQ